MQCWLQSIVWSYKKSKHQTCACACECVCSVTGLHPNRFGFFRACSLQMKALTSLYIPIFNQVRKVKEIQKYFLHYFPSQDLQNFFEGLRARCIFHV